MGSLPVLLKGLLDSVGITVKTEGFVQQIEEKLRELFKRFNLTDNTIKVRFAYLFGSIPRGLSGPLSDIDIAVYFNRSPSLEEELQLTLFLSRELRRNNIDLLVLNTTQNIILMDDIIREGIIVYDEDISLRKDFEVRIIHDTIDFKEQRKALLGR